MGGEKTAQNLAEFKHLSQQGERKKQSSVMIHCIHSREEKKKFFILKRRHTGIPNGPPFFICIGEERERGQVDFGRLQMMRNEKKKKKIQ